MAGGGRAAADMALVALVLRSRLPLSVVLWNLRTRSSIATALVSPYLTLISLHGSYIPDEPLDSSPDTFDPERAGRSIVSMVRVPVRTDVDMIRNSTALGQGQ
jgi:hypothetical protein